MAQIDGNTLIARSLKKQGVDHIFGIVGFPVFGIAAAAQSEGIQFIGMRNEQAASYAAGAVGYFTGRPGACLTVSGPGMIHGIAGLANAQENCWPMLRISGSSNSFQEGMGAFQEAPQVELARIYSKYAARPDSAARIPFYCEQAVRTSINGRPGAVYLDFPDDYLSGQVEESDAPIPARCAEPPRTEAASSEVARAIEVLRAAKRPLVIIGKGAAYARAEDEVRAFIEATQLPFLSSPMGKGVVSDEHPLSVAPARGLALEQADVVVLPGPRLNWIMHFGLPPRFAENVRVIQIDVEPEEIGTNVPSEVSLVGDAKTIVGQLNAALAEKPWSYPEDAAWWSSLSEKIEQNLQATEAMLRDDSVPMGYYRVLREIRDQIGRDAIICSEGANTMDIGRQVLQNYLPRHRLDAGSFGTMGIGLPYAIAAAVVHPEKRIVCIEGDSAFGFSGMEVETACRYGMNITFVIVNNNGIGGGLADYDRAKVPPMVYTPQARYEMMIEGFGGKGWFVETPDALSQALKEAIALEGPSIVNVAIDPRAQRKPQKFDWLTR